MLSSRVHEMPKRCVVLRPLRQRAIVCACTVVCMCTGCMLDARISAASFRARGRFGSARFYKHQHTPTRAGADCPDPDTFESIVPGTKREIVNTSDGRRRRVMECPAGYIIVRHEVIPGTTTPYYEGDECIRHEVPVTQRSKMNKLACMKSDPHT